MGKQSALPPTLPPRLIQREAAAAYLSISPTTLDVLVKEGTMPRPKQLGRRRKAWDVRELDFAVDNLPNESGTDNDIDKSADFGWDD